MGRVGNGHGYYLKTATADDEAIVRRLLRNTPMQGAVRISLEREPNAGISAEIEGFRHDTVFVLDSSDDQVVGMGTRSVRSLFVNGEVRSVGYLGQLRASPGRKGLKRLAAGFRALEQARRPDELAFDITSIIADNSAATRLLERGLAGLPRYVPLAELSTFVIPTTVRAGKAKHRVEPARPQELPGIASCLQAYNARYQFAPYWDVTALGDEKLCNNLSAQDFLFVRNGRKISSCLAVWDQREFKQVVVQGYSKTISRVRPLLNVMLSALGKPRLPKAPGELNLAYLSHVAVEKNDPDIFVDMIHAARELGSRRGIDYLVLGFVEAHPLHAVIRSRVPNYRYSSKLYTVHWNSSDIAVDLRGQIPHVEVAVL